VQKAGASIFGPCVNINTGKSTAWNVARAITMIKPCMEIAEIPVHVNVGMGVGAVPTCAYPPADATSRASKAFAEILKIDGY
jgi:dimethylamine--corrinoid protein Co-methyltransferase